MNRRSHRIQRVVAAVLPVGGLLVGLIYLAPSLLGYRALLPADLWGRYPPWGISIGEKTAAFPSNAILYDVAWNVAPNIWTVRRAYSQGEWPLWDPYARCGSPLLANGQSAPFAPTNIPQWLLPWPFGFAYAALVRLTLLWLGAWLLGRRLGLDRLWAGILSLGVVFCPSILSWFQHPNANVLVFLPWLLWAAEYLAQEYGRSSRISPWLPLALVQGAHLLGGHFHTSFSITFGTVCYLLARLPWTPARLAVRVRVVALTAIGVGSCIASVAMLPALEFLRGSYTFMERQANGSWHLPADIFHLFLNPMYFGNHIKDSGTPWTGPANWNLGQQYIGGTVWVLIAFGVVNAVVRLVGRRRSIGRDACIQLAGLVVLALPAACLAYGWQPVQRLLTRLPPFSFNTNVYFAALVQVALCACGCLLASRVSPIAHHRRRLAAVALGIGAGAAVVASAWLVVMAQHGKWSDRILVAVAGSLIVCVALLLVANRRRARVLVLGLGILWACDVVPVWRGFHVQVPIDWTIPSRFAGPFIDVLTSQPNPRIIAEDLVAPRSLTYWGISDFRSYEWPESMRHGLFRAQLLGLKTDNLTVNDLRDKSRLVSLNETGAQSLVTSNLMRGKVIKPVWHRGPSTTYRILGAPPLAAVYKADAVTCVKGTSECVELMKSAQVAAHECVIIEDPSATTGARLQDSGIGVAADLERVGMNGLRISRLDSAGGVLVVRESYDPGWKAWVDGKPARIWPAELQFMAINVAPGSMEAEFRYTPASFRWGALLSLAALVAVLILGQTWILHRLKQWFSQFSRHAQSS